MYKQSNTEKRVLEELRGIGLKPVEQYKISRMTLDIAFPKLKVAVEIDGSHHLTESQKRADGRRDDYLQSNGWKVRRFTAKEVHENPRYVAIEIRNFLNRVTQQKKEVQTPIVPDTNDIDSMDSWVAKGLKQYQIPYPVSGTIEKPLSEDTPTLPKQKESSYPEWDAYVGEQSPKRQSHASLRGQKSKQQRKPVIKISTVKLAATNTPCKSPVEATARERKVPLIFKLAIVILFLVLAAHAIQSQFAGIKYNWQQPKPQPSLPAISKVPELTTIESMWSIIKIGETAEDFDKQAQTAGFELVDPPWNSPHLEHFEIRQTGSNLDVIHVYFKSQAYNVYSSTGRIDTTLPNNGLSWSPTHATIYRKSFYHNGTQTRSEP